LRDLFGALFGLHGRFVEFGKAADGAGAMRAAKNDRDRDGRAKGTHTKNPSPALSLSE
jgi:hypothetical protein